MYILGIGDVTHDTSVCLMKDSKVLVAIEEERLTRVKHNTILDPKKYTLKEQGEHFCGQLEKLTVEIREKKHRRGIDYCLSAVDINFKDIDIILVSSLFADFPFKNQACFISHHMAHAASTFYPSPFKNAAILVVDGYGTYTEGVSESILYAQGENNHLNVLNTVTGFCDFSEEDKKENLKETQIIFKNSLGVFYQNISLLIGMGHFGEGKTMGLASYGKDRPEFNKIRDYIQLGADGQLNIDNRSIFLYCLKIIDEAKTFLTQEMLFQFYADLAYKHQQILEEVIIHCCNYLYQMTGEKNICLAGGVALNGVANNRILQKTGFNNIFVQPASGDNGISIGCAMYGAHALANNQREYQNKKIFSPYLGRTYNKTDTDTAVEKHEGRLLKIIPTLDFYQYAAKLISEGKIIAWYQGGCEIGPRALGNRSILADPRCASMKDIINFKVKCREGFRPFAPAVLAEYAQEYFDLQVSSPYMLLVPLVKPSKKIIIPAVTHVDGSARVQTVHKEISPNFYRLIENFYVLTGIPLLLNTSFNGNNEPIVETPEDAIKCFLSNNIDFLFLNGQVFINTINSIKSNKKENIYQITEKIF
jgi:carbamoyltransferase